MNWETILEALLRVTLYWVTDWLRNQRNARKGIRIETELEPGPITREYGFTETTVKITISNESGGAIGIRDVRLMFSSDWGAPVAPEAPALRSHAELPARLESGSMASWYIPAESLARLLESLSTRKVSRERKVRVCPRFVTVTGKAHTGSSFAFSMDPNSFWPL